MGLAPRALAPCRSSLNCRMANFAASDFPTETYYKQIRALPQRWSRNLFLAAAVIFGPAGCTELPSDIGVHRIVPSRSRRSWRRIIRSRPHGTAIPPRPANTKSSSISPRSRRFFTGVEPWSAKRIFPRAERITKRRLGNTVSFKKDANHISSQYGQIVPRPDRVLVRDADATATPRAKGARFFGVPMPYFLRFKAVTECTPDSSCAIARRTAACACR